MEDNWYNRRNVAVTCCPCDCCVKAFDLIEDGKETSPACTCIGLLGNRNEGQCHCWFCVETNGLKPRSAE